MGSVWRGLRNYCLAFLLLYCLLLLYVKEHPRRGFLGEDSEAWTRALRLFLKRGDDVSGRG